MVAERPEAKVEILRDKCVFHQRAKPQARGATTTRGNSKRTKASTCRGTRALKTNFVVPPPSTTISPTFVLIGKGKDVVSVERQGEIRGAAKQALVRLAAAIGSGLQQQKFT